nr:hypothetical protein [Tanacetum cinerariifolium]
MVQLVSGLDFKGLLYVSCKLRSLIELRDEFGGKAGDLGSIGKKLDKIATIQAGDFNSDAFTKSAQKVKFLIKIMTSQIVEMASEFTSDNVRINKRRRKEGDEAVDKNIVEPIELVEKEEAVDDVVDNESNRSVNEDSTR